jgi:hypothetical protein
MLIPAGAAMAIMATATVASAAIGAYGAIQSGQAQQAAANYSAQVASNNAVIAGYNAKAATDAGTAAVTANQMKVAALEGAQRASEASSGVDPNSGSPLDLQVSTAKVGELDSLTISNNAARTAYGYEVQGMNQTAQAALDTAQGQNAATAGEIGAVSSVMSSAASLSGKWAQYQLQAGSNGGGSPNPASGSIYSVNGGLGGQY